MTDAAAIHAVLNGNSNRYEELVCRYLPLVRGLCAAFVNDPATQDDLVQDTFLKGYERLNQLKHAERFGPWLATIARRSCLDWHRREKRKKKLEESLVVTPPPAAQVTPDELMSTDERRALVRSIIGTLPEKTREAMTLYYVEGVGTEEGAAFLSISPATFRKRLEHGRKLASVKLWELCRGDTCDTRKDKEQEAQVIAAVAAFVPSWQGTVSVKNLHSRSATQWIVTSTAGAILASAAVLVLIVTAAWHLSDRGTPPAPVTPESLTLQSAGQPGGTSETPDPAADAAGDLPAPSASPTASLTVRVVYDIPGAESTDPIPAAGAKVRITPFYFDEPLFTKTVQEASIPTPFVEPLRRAFKPAHVQDLLLAQLALSDADISGPEMSKLFKSMESGPGGQRVPVLPPFCVARYEEASVHTVDSNGELIVDTLAIGSYVLEATTDPTAAPTAAVCYGPLDVVHVVDGDEGPVACSGSGEVVTLRVWDLNSYITGTVIDASTHQPLGKMDIVFHTMDGSPESAEGHCETDAQGAFVSNWFWMPPGDLTLAFQSDWFLPTEVRGSRELGTPLSVVVSVTPRATISGTVVFDDGNPANGASIMLTNEPGSGWGIALTDSNGHYTAPHDGGHLALHARLGRAITETIDLTLSSDESVQQDFVLPRLTNVTLKFAPYDNRTIETAYGYNLHTDHANIGHSPAPLTDNCLLLPGLLAGQYSALVHFNEYQDPLVEFDVEEGQADFLLSVPLEKPATGARVLVTKAGTPVSEASVVVTPSDPVFGVNTLAWFSADETGLVKLDGLIPGTYFVDCHNTRASVEVPSQAVVELKLAETRPTSLTFDVKAYDDLDNGRPMLSKNPSLYILRPDGMIWSEGLIKGDNWLFYFAPGYPAAITRVTVTEEAWDQSISNNSGSYGTVEVHLGPSGGIEGRITGANAANRKIAVFPADFVSDLLGSNASRRMAFRLGYAMAQYVQSDADGLFELQYLPPGTYLVALSPDEISESVRVLEDHMTGPVTIASQAESPVPLD